MRDNLKDRIVEFSKSLDSTHFLDRADSIQRFIENELAARDIAYTLTTQDLANIHSNAVNCSINSPAIPNGSQELALFWTLGVTNWLRGKDMLYFVIGGQKGVPNDLNKNTDDKDRNRN